MVHVNRTGELTFFLDMLMVVREPMRSASTATKLSNPTIQSMFLLNQCEMSNR